MVHRGKERGRENREKESNELGKVGSRKRGSGK